MKATFKFENIESAIPVNEFNSPKAALRWALYFYGMCSVEFDEVLTDWVNAGEKDRDRLSRTQWIDRCLESRDEHNKQYKPEIDASLTVPEDLPRIDFRDTFECIVARIRKMGETFEVPMLEKPTNLGKVRLEAFVKILSEEVEEFGGAIVGDEADDTIDLVTVADTLGDVIVYVVSEAQRWGIPIVAILHAILDSQDSKLIDGKPLWNGEHTKFIKGPNYVAPEPVIAQILEEYSNGIDWTTIFINKIEEGLNDAKGKDSQ